MILILICSDLISTKKKRKAKAKPSFKYWYQTDKGLKENYKLIVEFLRAIPRL